jgi:hypothetical protein
MNPPTTPTLAPLAFIDTETTGLDPDVHDIWEVALILRLVDRHDDGHQEYVADQEYVWQLPADPSRADLRSLEVGGWRDRRKPPCPRPFPGDDDARDVRMETLTGRWQISQPPYAVPEDLLGDWATWFSHLTWGAHLVAAVPSFDDRRLFDLLRRNGAAPAWHYHVIDVEALAVGYLRGAHRGFSPEGPLDDRSQIQPPWNSVDLSRAVGIEPGLFARHTALGDARWARALYDAVVAPAAPAHVPADRVPDPEPIPARGPFRVHR